MPGVPRMYQCTVAGAGRVGHRASTPGPGGRTPIGHRGPATERAPIGDRRRRPGAWNNPPSSNRAGGVATVDSAQVVALGLGGLIGLVMAMTGAGGGTLAVPLLIFALDLPLARAAPLSLVAVGAAACFGALLGLRAGHVRYRAAALMAASGWLGAPLGVWLGLRMPRIPLILAFALVLLWSAWRMWHGPGIGKPGAAASRPCRIGADGRLRWTAACARGLAGAGFAAGVLASLLGVGGGFVIVPALMRVTDCELSHVTATALAVIALVTAGSLAATLLAGGALDGSFALPFVAGTIAGLVLGRPWALRLPARHVQRAFAGAAMVAALLLAGRALA